MDILARILCMLIGYGFGCVSTSYLYGKARGIDVREHGSGNAGTTNTLRVMGRKAGAIVLFGDMMKTFLAIIFTWLIFHWFFPDMDYLLKIYTAAGVILGHDYPFYMKFKGGKGIACSGAMILSFYWGIIPGEVIIFFGIFFLTHYVSLASIFMYIGFLVQLVLFGQAGLLGMTQPMLIELYIIVALLTALALYQHRQNIVRLVKGEEKAIYLKKTKKDMDDVASDEVTESEADITESVEEKNVEVVEKKDEVVETEEDSATEASAQEEQKSKTTVIEPVKEVSLDNIDDEMAAPVEEDILVAEYDPSIKTPKVNFELAKDMVSEVSTEFNFVLEEEADKEPQTEFNFALEEETDKEPATEFKFDLTEDDSSAKENVDSAPDEDEYIS